MSKQNENEIELNGKKYIAKPKAGCSGCAFNRSEINCNDFEFNIPCVPWLRADRDSVIFVEVKK